MLRSLLNESENTPLGLLEFEDGNSTDLRIAGNYLPVDET